MVSRNDSTARKKHIKLVPVRAASWEEILSGHYDYEELKSLADKHQQILDTETRDEIAQIAHLHALDLMPEVRKDSADWSQVLNYIDLMLEKGSIDPLTVREIHKTNGNAVCFSRIRTDKPTAKTYNDSGVCIEAVRMYPSGAVVRTFHSVFKDAEAWKKATKGQKFYFALAEYINQQFESKNQLTEDEQYIADRIARLDAIRPLESENQVLTNVFVNTEDLQDRFRRTKPSIDEMVQQLTEVTDIDLITSFFSRGFKKTKQGKALYKKGFRKNHFNAKDYRREVFEELLLRADKEFFRELYDNGVISTAGIIMDEKAFNVFYEGADEKAQILDFLDITNSGLDEEKCFTPFDLNLSNLMFSSQEKRYTPVDFECSREDPLEFLLFNRWCEAGIYDHKGSSFVLQDGRIAESALLDSAYETIERLCNVAGETVPDKEQFLHRFGMQKKKQLLRLAKRYKQIEEKEAKKKANPERAGAHKRFFYTLLTYELAKEGKIVGIDDPKLDYLNTLFEKPLTQAEISDIAEQHNPSFRTQEEISPLSIMDVKSRNRAMIERYKSSRARNRIKKWAIAIGATCLSLGVIVGSYIGVQAYTETLEDKNNLKTNVEFFLQCQTLYKIRTGASIGINKLSNMLYLRNLDKEFKDKRVANAAFLDYSLVYEAMQETGKKDWDSIREYMDKKSDEEFKKIDFDEYYEMPQYERPFRPWMEIAYWAENITKDQYIDNWAWKAIYADADKNYQKNKAEAIKRYKARKEAKQKAKRHPATCFGVPNCEYGSINLGK